MKKSIFTSSKLKKGFGIMEVLVAALVLGFLYMALMNLQLGNRMTLLRIRGRDGAVETAQYVMDSLRTVGLPSLRSCEKNDDSEKNCLIQIEKEWARGNRVGGGSASIKYDVQITVENEEDYTAESKSKFETVNNIYAKRVVVKVEWPFNNSIQSIDVSGVIR
jgi:hypothetical protein